MSEEKPERPYGCRFCEAVYPATYETAGGKTRDGFEKLVLHLQYAHEDAFREAVMPLTHNPAGPPNAYCAEHNTAKPHEHAAKA